MAGAVAVSGRPLIALVCCMLWTTGVASERQLDIETLDLPGQSQPNIVADPAGGYVLTWIDREDERAHLRFALLDAEGRVGKRGEIASGGDWFVNWADFPSLAIADNGDWVTYFLRRSDASRSYAYDVLTTRSTDRGASWSRPALLHDDGTPTEHGFVSLLPDGGERVLAVWLDGRRSGGGHDPVTHADSGGSMTLRSAVLAREGEPRDARELDARTCDCCNTDALRTAQGPLLAYRDRSDDEIRDIAWLQRSGRRWSQPQRVHDDGWRIRACPVNGPALALAGEAPVAVWTTMQDDAVRVRVATRDATGRWRAPRELDSGGAVLGRVDAVAWHARDVLVSWIGTRSSAPAPAAQRLRVAWLDGDLRTRAELDVVTLPPGRATGMPRLAAQGDSAVLVWTGGEAGRTRVHGVRLRAAPAHANTQP